MYQSLKLTLLLTLVLLVRDSQQSSDLLAYRIHSSNPEISYFINYLDNLFYILSQTLNEYRAEAHSSNATGESAPTELVRNSTCFNHLEYTVSMARKETPWAIQSK